MNRRRNHHGADWTETRVWWCTIPGGNQIFGSCHWWGNRPGAYAYLPESVPSTSDWAIFLEAQVCILPRLSREHAFCEPCPSQSQARPGLDLKELVSNFLVHCGGAVSVKGQLHLQLSVPLYLCLRTLVSLNLLLSWPPAYFTSHTLMMNGSHYLAASYSLSSRAEKNAKWDNEETEVCSVQFLSRADKYGTASLVYQVEPFPVIFKLVAAESELPCGWNQRPWWCWVGVVDSRVDNF